MYSYCYWVIWVPFAQKLSAKVVYLCKWHVSQASKASEEGKQGPSTGGGQAHVVDSAHGEVWR